MKLPIVIAQNGSMLWLPTLEPVHTNNGIVSVLNSRIRYNQEFEPVLPGGPVVREYSELEPGFLFCKSEGKLYSLLDGKEVTQSVVDVYGASYTKDALLASMVDVDLKQPPSRVVISAIVFMLAVLLLSKWALIILAICLGTSARMRKGGEKLALYAWSQAQVMVRSLKGTRMKVKWW